MNLFEIDENAEIRRNVEFLLSTYKYSCPMYRNFGLTAIFIDKPNSRAESIARDEIEQAIKEYEPRAEIDEISFTYENNRLYPIIKLKG
ncbi:MAG TPA: GPW/gp25 family protein [Candidatus Mucispirillum faecigallinarum]|uniref:GPW/gp25 family protein n=1 Tax=Candidatus Mucispirillum faecigallinarum TaxID=2838699 RepID=A0A9D2GTM2_9BACT|nr:GPW/gp25 family protein [Candidatus Mucispirillum faecigallinarum]